MSKKFILIAGFLVFLGGASMIAVQWFVHSEWRLAKVTDNDVLKARKKRGMEVSQPVLPVATASIPLTRPLRLAIGSLGMADDANNLQLIDLVTAQLTEVKGLELVERQSLNKVLQEIQLNLSGLVRAKDAIRVGKLLRADWFLQASTVRLARTNFIVARIVDAKTGVMQDITLIGDIDRPLLAAKALSDFTRHVRQTAAQPSVREFLALGQFADAGVNNRQATFPSQLRSYLMAAYQNSTTTLLEREYVDALLQEVRLDLAGLAPDTSTNEVRPLQSAFWVVDGIFQSQETRGFEVEVSLRINRVFDRPTQQSFRGKPDENLFRQIKRAVDSALSSKNRAIFPTRLTESRLQMAAGQNLYSLATGGQRMEIMPPGMYMGGYSPQEPSTRKRNLEEAIRAFQTVLLLEPDNLEAKFNIAACCHEESVGRIEEARGYLRELASSTNYGLSQRAIHSLGESYSWEDGQEAAKWFNLALKRAQSTNDADYAKQFVNYSVAGNIERNSRAGIALGSNELAVLTEQLVGRVRGAESVMRGKGGIIDAWYGLENFASAFGKNKKAAAEQIAAVLPMLRTNFPALVPHLLASAVTFLPDTNSPIYGEFLLSLDSLRAQPGTLLSPEMYFENAFLTTYDWCLDHGLYGLAVELVSTKRKLSESISAVKMDSKDGVRLGFAYLKSQDYTNALKAFEGLGETPVIMQHNGVWGRAFTPFLPAKSAELCRAKLGVSKPTDDARFELGDACLHLHAKAVFVVEPDGLWLVIGRQLHHLTLDLQTNLTVSLPAGPYSSPNALCLDRDCIWIGTAGDGLIEYNRTTGKIRQYSMANGLLMDEITSLYPSDNLLWIGYGAENERGESRGGLGRLDLGSRRFSSFTPALTAELVPPTYSTGGRVGDPADRPPRSPVVLIGKGPSTEIVLNVAHAGVRRYFPDKDQWVPLKASQEQNSVHSFAANSEHLITGLSIARYDVDLRDGSGRGQTNEVITTRKNLTEQEFGTLRADPITSKKIKASRMGWQPALGIYQSANSPPQIVADDGSLPAYPKLLLLAGSDVIVAGEAYIIIYDLKQKRVRKLARIASSSVDRMQLGAGFLWAQFDNHIYRTSLGAIGNISPVAELKPR